MLKHSKDLTALYRRGHLTVCYDNKGGNYCIIDTYIRCPKGRAFSVSDFASEDDATKYVLDRWADDIAAPPVEKIKFNRSRKAKKEGGAT